jgi:hypothetical protein
LALTNGLREKIARELLNEMTSATSQILQALRLNATAQAVFSEMLTASREQWKSTAQ